MLRFEMKFKVIYEVYHRLQNQLVLERTFDDEQSVNRYINRNAICKALLNEEFFVKKIEEKDCVYLPTNKAVSKEQKQLEERYISFYCPW